MFFLALREVIFEHKNRVLIFSTNLKYFSFYEEFSEILAQIHIIIHEKYPLSLSYFNDTWSFSTNFWEISWKTVQRGPNSSMLTDTHMTKLRVVFRNIAYSPKNSRTIRATTCSANTWGIKKPASASSQIYLTEYDLKMWTRSAVRNPHSPLVCAVSCFRLPYNYLGHTWKRLKLISLCISP